jgi:hypothetical protein
MARKSYGSWRQCSNFRLNLVTAHDVYLPPKMLDFAAQAAG